MGTSRLFRNTPAFLAILLLGSGSLALAASLASTLMIIGHRGMGKASAPIPENSLSAIREALREGVTAVEFDVQLSSDGEVVLAHDEDLQRITGVRKCVSQSSLSDLQKLPLMDGLGHAHPAERLSRLSEVLSFLKSMDDPAKPFIADIHVKVYDGLRGDLPTHFINHCP
ncbi:MAG: glycerophosphodiester phosphodiesterase, partial [Bdellovibrionota bacterium]